MSEYQVKAVAQSFYNS